MAGWFRPPIHHAASAATCYRAVPLIVKSGATNGAEGIPMRIPESADPWGRLPVHLRSGKLDARLIRDGNLRRGHLFGARIERFKVLPPCLVLALVG